MRLALASLAVVGRRGPSLLLAQAELGRARRWASSRVPVVDRGARARWRATGRQAFALGLFQLLAGRGVPGVGRSTACCSATGTSPTAGSRAAPINRATNLMLVAVGRARPSR